MRTFRISNAHLERARRNTYFSFLSGVIAAFPLWFIEEYRPILPAVAGGVLGAITFYFSRRAFRRQESMASQHSLELNQSNIVLVNANSRTELKLDRFKKIIVNQAMRGITGLILISTDNMSFPLGVYDDMDSLLEELTKRMPSASVSRRRFLHL